MSILKSLVAAGLLGASLAVQAACLSDAQAVALVDAILTKTPAVNPEGLSEADGACSRAKVNALLLLQYRTVIGYKAGLTNPATQKRFGAANRARWLAPGARCAGPHRAAPRLLGRGRRAVRKAARAGRLHALAEAAGQRLMRGARTRYLNSTDTGSAPGSPA